MRRYVSSFFLLAAFLATTLHANRSAMVITSFDRPCRIIDTRLAGGPLAPNVPRNFVVAGAAGFDAQGGTADGCGIPTTAASAIINFVAVNPQGGGNLRGVAYPGTITGTGSILNYQALSPTLNIANELLFPICERGVSPSCPFDMTIQANGAGTNLVADVLGYATAHHEHSAEDITSGTLDVERLPSSVALESEILPAVLAGDGTGSDLDADRLDGLDSSSFAAASHNHDADYEKKYAHTIVVRSSGTPLQNGSALMAAMAGISGNTEETPYLIKLEPGVFEITDTLTEKYYVDMEGSGENQTVIRKTGTGAGPAVEMWFGGTLRHLAVEDLTTDGDAIGIGNAWILSHVRVKAHGGATTVATGIQGGSMRFDHVTVDVFSNSAEAVGIRQIIVSYMILTNIEIEVHSDANNTRGILSLGSSLLLNHIDVHMSGNGTHYGIDSVGGSWDDVSIYGLGGTTNCGVRIGNLQATRLFIYSTSGNNTYGIILTGTLGFDSYIADSRITATGGFTYNNGIDATSASFTLSNVTITGSGGIGGTGVFVNPGGTPVVIIDRSTISHTDNAVVTLGPQVKIGASKLIGESFGNLVCVGSYNGAYAPLGSGCI